ncbi:MAG: winged helix-turn-helix domain-containing protein [Serratia symbiotica]|nr:winged helix-turn-helix domain-containing protein [Serratia symbiotica]
MLTIEINKLFNWTLHPVSLRRWLHRAGVVWRRAAPNLHIREPDKGGKTGGYRYRIKE